MVLEWTPVVEAIWERESLGNQEENVYLNRRRNAFHNERIRNKEWHWQRSIYTFWYVSNVTLFGTVWWIQHSHMINTLKKYIKDIIIAMLSWPSFCNISAKNKAYVMKRVWTCLLHGRLSSCQIWSVFIEFFKSYGFNKPITKNIWTVLSLTVYVTLINPSKFTQR